MDTNDELQSFCHIKILIFVLEEAKNEINGEVVLLVFVFSIHNMKI